MQLMDQVGSSVNIYYNTQSAWWHILYFVVSGMHDLSHIKSQIDSCSVTRIYQSTKNKNYNQIEIATVEKRFIVSLFVKS